MNASATANKQIGSTTRTSGKLVCVSAKQTIKRVSNDFCFIGSTKPGKHDGKN